MYTVFISYSWKKQNDRKFVEQSIKGIPGINVVVDRHSIDYGDENLWVKIRNMLGKSDLVIALLSEESLSSQAVIDELARADDRGIKILPIKSKELDAKDPRIPYYLRLSKYMEFDNANAGDFLGEIQEAVKGKMQSGANLTSKAYSELRNCIVESNRTIVGDMVLAKVIDQTRLEAKDINTGRYEVNLGTDFDFLKRAEPLFGSAKSIYATTVSSVSSFWTDKENKGQAIKYLLAQSGRVVRIFVFDKPENLVRYREILEANCEQYGKNGAVFITSKSNYIERIVGGFCTNEEAKQRLLGIDFGVLEYDFSAKLFAWLRGQYLGFKDAETPHTDFQVDCDNFSRLLEKMASDCNQEYSEQYGTIKWQIGKSDDKEFLSFCVEKLFGAVLGDLAHIVLIKDTNNMLSETVASVKHHISGLIDRYGTEEIDFKCDDVWFGENIVVDARDRVYGGELIHDQEYKYMLYMRLPTRRNLEQWYNFKHHSELRKQIYCKLVQSISLLYDQMDALLESGDATLAENKKQVAQIYREVEKKASGEIRRLDYEYNESPNSIVDMPAYPFIADYRQQKNLRDTDTSA